MPPTAPPTPQASTPAARGLSRRTAKKRKPTFKEDAAFWIKAILIFLFLRAFVGEPYRIPSESMEDTLLVGDFLIVSKLHYGPRTPSTLGIPSTGIYVPGITLPHTRLPGFSRVQRGDVVVFNYPAAFDVARGEIPEAVPFDRRAPYIKRVVAVPGDTVAVLDKVLHIDGRARPIAPTMKQRWRVTSADGERPNARVLQAEGVEFIEGSDVRLGGVLADPRQYDIVGTPAEAEAFAARAGVARVDPFVLPETAQQPMIYPQGSGWNSDQYGPITVPGEGWTVALDSTTWPVYAEVIQRYEGRPVGQTPAGYTVDGRVVTSYTFEQNYYFVMGDNRDNSVDGRYWGFVPETHMIGKAIGTFISFESFLPPIPRLNRFFRPIP